MSYQSIIEHKANMHYVEFREDHLTVCMNLTYKKPGKDGKKSKASPHCQALILAILEHWTNTKRDRKEELYVYMSYPQWNKEMYGLFGRSVIIDSMDELLEEGLVSRQPYKMFGRDSFKYLLNYKEVNKRIRALPDIDPEPPAPPENSESDPSTSKRVPSTNGCDPSTSKRVTRPQVNGSHLQVDGYPSISRRNLSSNLSSTQLHNLTSTEKENNGNEIVDPHDPSSSSHSFSNSFSQEEETLKGKESTTHNDTVPPPTTQGSAANAKGVSPTILLYNQRKYEELSEGAKFVWDEWCKRCEKKQNMPHQFSPTQATHCEALADKHLTVEIMLKVEEWATSEKVDKKGYYNKECPWNLKSLRNELDNWLLFNPQGGRDKQEEKDQAKARAEAKNLEQLEKLRQRAAQKTAQKGA